MTRNEFFHEIAKSFFKDLTTDLDGLKDMIRGALPVFGTLETEITEKEDGEKYIRFIDKHEAQFVIAPEGVDTDDVDTDMSSVVIGLHLDKDGKIGVVEHNMHMFTRANKNSVLLCASLIGKIIDFD
jgi:hypothetical protein